MDFKPGDFFIGVIEFIGALVPGAVLLFLENDMLPSWVANSLPSDSFQKGAAVLIGSYVLGHFLLGYGVHLNRAVNLLFPVSRDTIYKAVAARIAPLGNADRCPTAEEARRDAFYHACAVVRLESPAATSEIERNMADYKLFRSLTLLFAIDSITRLFLFIRGQSDWHRPLAMGVLFGLAGWRFCFLLNWTYRITFEHFALITDEKKPSDG